MRIVVRQTHVWSGLKIAHRRGVGLYMRESSGLSRICPCDQEPRAFSATIVVLVEPVAIPDGPHRLEATMIDADNVAFSQ